MCVCVWGGGGLNVFLAPKLALAREGGLIKKIAMLEKLRYVV